MSVVVYHFMFDPDDDWLSSHDSDFNYDVGASFRPDEYDAQVYNFGTLAPGRGDCEGVSVFVKDDAGTSSGRTRAMLAGSTCSTPRTTISTWFPAGRGEHGNFPQYWLRRHDEYDVAPRTR